MGRSKGNSRKAPSEATASGSTIMLTAGSAVAMLLMAGLGAKTILDDSSAPRGPSRYDLALAARPQTRGEAGPADKGAELIKWASTAEGFVLNVALRSFPVRLALPRH